MADSPSVPPKPRQQCCPWCGAEMGEEEVAWSDEPLFCSDECAEDSRG